MTYGVFKDRIAKIVPCNIVYRSMKHLNNEEVFKQDLEAVPFQICKICDDPEDSYWTLDYLYSKEVDEHACNKEKTHIIQGCLV